MQERPSHSKITETYILETDTRSTPAGLNSWERTEDQRNENLQSDLYLKKMFEEMSKICQRQKEKVLNFLICVRIQEALLGEGLSSPVKNKQN
ncbi:Echinoderm Microtubule-Associated Protein-Like 4 [Manis pentadactyla]|nr:Echinoderm Microtubule-Associated Protein-Like 4 [Manis pentadactyla]